MRAVNSQPSFSFKIDPDVTGIQFDSRRVSPGDVFLAIKGHKSDGHDYIDDAIGRGAVAICVENGANVSGFEIPIFEVSNGRESLADLAVQFYENPTKQLFTVGVTGTKGKSSVAHMAAGVLGEEQTKLISTITNALQREVEQTTPESTTIQSIARDAIDAKLNNLVLETSAHALAQERVRGVDFDVAAFTNLSHDHFDYFHTWESYFAAKLKLFQKLKKSATAVVNLDDPHSQKIKSNTSARVIGYSLKAEADLAAKIHEMNAAGTSVSITTPSGSIDLQLKLPGDFYVENALAAVGIGLAAGMDLGTIKARLEAVEHIEGRFERYRSNLGFDIVIDFAHSPDSLERMLKTLSSFHDRVITVFGCGGGSDRVKRPEMGRISGLHSTHTFVTNDNPKDEDPIEILREIESGLKSQGAPYDLIEDRREAIAAALEFAQIGDVVFIAGKGHERTQSFGDHEVQFNDREYLVELGVIEAKQGILDERSIITS